MSPQRIALFGLLFVALGIPLVASRLKRAGARPVDLARPEARQSAMDRYGFHFEEVSQQAGVRVIHEPPRLDPKLDPIMPEIASMGAAISVVDFDRDGWLDFYATNSKEGSANHLFRNQRDGKFADVAAGLGVADLNRPEDGVSMGAIWGDYDNDGFEDLFLYRWGKPELFHNEKGIRFTRVTNGSGLPGWVNANSAAWLDYDRDGKLDLLIGGYYDENLNLWKLADTKVMPESFEYARNGGRKYLMRGTGAGKFEDVTERTGLDSRRWALAVAAADLRGTGYPDIVIANDYGVSEFFANTDDGRGGRRFVERGKATGIGERPKSGMNVAFGDIRNDGKLAIYITNITEPGVLTQGNNLWVPRDGTSGDRLAYDNMAEVMGVEQGGWSFGAQFGDLNNDGLQDLFLTNGYISADRGQSYWYQFSEIAGGHTAIIQDAKNWPAIKNMSLSGYQQKRVWLNDGAGQFVDVAPNVGVTETFDGRAVVQADFWNRGALDVAVAHQKAPLLLYKNQVSPDRHWIQFELSGTRSNASAIGAQVMLHWDGKQQLQQVSGASGFCAQNQRRLHFGLGAQARVEKAVITWPSGKVETITQPAPDKLHKITEGA